MNRHLSAVACGLLAMVAYAGSCRADTITDWDTKATAVASSAALGEREVAIVDLAMFDAVNSIARRYRPYLEQLPATEPTSADAAAASANGRMVGQVEHTIVAVGTSCPGLVLGR